MLHLAGGVGAAGFLHCGLSASLGRVPNSRGVMMNSPDIDEIALIVGGVILACFPFSFFIS